MIKGKDKAKILIIDDSEIVLEASKMILEDVGYEVLTLNTPFGTSSVIAKERPDLVLLDISMPALSGDTLVQMIRNNKSLDKTKIVLHSDKPIPELSATVIRCGADGYVQKTLDHDSFVRQVQGWL